MVQAPVGGLSLFDGLKVGEASRFELRDGGGHWFPSMDSESSVIVLMEACKSG